MMLHVNCWSCARPLIVEPDRRDRRPEVAGENMVSHNLRVCVDCWGRIKRPDVTQINLRQHLTALNR
jgi:hypothetical protein